MTRGVVLVASGGKCRNKIYCRDKKKYCNSCFFREQKPKNSELNTKKIGLIKKNWQNY